MVAVVAAFTLVLLTQAVSADPTVTISNPAATIIGSSSNGVDSFSGIPYAQPPVGNLRLRPPQPLQTSLGLVTATNTPIPCPEYGEQVGGFESAVSPEDCLTLDIQRPSTAQNDSGLPVLFWIYGGGFTSGSTSGYNADSIINLSINMGAPIIYVTANYRLGAFGWLGGNEVLQEGLANIGLLDQRLGLQWIADNIEQFGGDPAKVTLWGQSAGSISVFDQMALYKGSNTYNGNALFRGAIMNSGSIVPTDPVNGTKAQDVYDSVVEVAGCSSANDTLDCLRGLPYPVFKLASDSVPDAREYQSIAAYYFPRPDGVLLADSPEVLVEQGYYAPVPFIVGDQEDEGTIFALLQRNVTNTTDIINFFSTYWYINTPHRALAELVGTYPNIPAAGSPFRTGNAYEVYPEYKRMAAIMGDVIFTLTRRAFLHRATTVNPTVPNWSYLGSEKYGNPIFGTAHGADVRLEYKQDLGFFATSALTYYISFANTLDPNALASGYEQWPQWGESQSLLWFQNTTNNILADDFRNVSYTVLLQNQGMFRL